MKTASLKRSWNECMYESNLMLRIKVYFPWNFHLHHHAYLLASLIFFFSCHQLSGALLLSPRFMRSCLCSKSVASILYNKMQWHTRKAKARIKTVTGFWSFCANVCSVRLLLVGFVVASAVCQFASSFNRNEWMKNCGLKKWHNEFQQIFFDYCAIAPVCLFAKYGKQMNNIYSWHLSITFSCCWFSFVSSFFSLQNSFSIYF